MIDVTKIWGRLFLGSLLDAERLGRPNPHCIGAVVSLSATVPCNTRRDINYVHLHVEDTQPILVRQFDAIMHAIAEHIRRGKVLVQGVNVVKKNKKVTHQGARGAKEGGITHQEAPIDVSNVQLADPDSKRAARVGYRFDEDGHKVRVARPSGKDV